MKKVISIVLISFLVACGPSTNEVVEINDKLVEQLGVCTKSEASFFQVCKTFEPLKIESELKTFTSVCNKADAEISAVKVPEELDALKVSAASLVKKFISIKTEYSEYARLYSLSEDRYTREDSVLTSQTAEKINTEIETSFQNFEKVQKEVSKKYNFIINKPSSKK
jgi:hypothetical protein